MILNEHELIGFTKPQIVEAYLKLVEAHGQEKTMRIDEAGKAINLKESRDELRKYIDAKDKEYDHLSVQLTDLKTDYNRSEEKHELLKKDLNGKDNERDVLHEQLHDQDKSKGDHHHQHTHYHYHIPSLHRLTQIGDKVIIKMDTEEDDPSNDLY